MEYVIIGGDAAGMSAAMQIWKYDKDAKITVFEQGDTYSYGQCGLPYYIGGQVDELDDLISRTADEFQQMFGMKTYTNTRVDQIDAENKLVKVKDLVSGRLFQKQYDKLLIATGGRASIPPFPGTDLEGVYTLKTVHDAEAIANSLEAEVKHVTVIGGGYIGLEMVESFKKRGFHVRMIVRGAYPGAIFDEELAGMIVDEAKRQGVLLHTNENTLALKGKGTVEAVVTDQGSYETDLVLLATGLKANTEIAEKAKLSLGVNKGILVNEHLETSVKDIYAAGDCALHYHRLLKKDVHIPLGTTANKQGRIAGMNMAGQGRKFKGIVGTSIIQFFNLSLGKVGLNEKELQKEKIDYEAVTVQSNDIASYYEGVAQITAKLTYDQQTRRLLGGQIIGEKGVDKRIDVLVLALTMGMTIDDLEDLDLSYAPPYNSVWDVLQRASRKAKG